MNMIGKYLRIGNTKGTWTWRERGEQGKGGREGERQGRGGETTCRIALVKKASAGHSVLEAFLGSGSEDQCCMTSMWQPR